MPLAAYLESAAPAKRRRHPRRTLRLSSTGGKPDGDAIPLTILNISSAGMLIAGEVEFAKGETIDIDLPQAGRVRAKIVWSSAGQMGCIFAAPISQATLSAVELRSDAGDMPENLLPTALATERFSARLKRLRNRKGLTQADLAEALGVSEPAVCAWELGRSRPRMGRMETLSRLLDVSIADLVGSDARADVPDILAEAKQHIARIVGTTADKIHIMIEI
ncbi:helix-turn-helix transcriptional regulator [Sphingopyxis indica]|uniref:DNA-binding transcriptional regulator, XRE-family HTH domain n=1 Tax=Sphingopyxis indica TaxID=436663 RepID=A0A239K4B2_9SPHN|nr:helix-turn-helix transcriptional regulator [Sphingopyxis indica]SNT12985.1 DNA-binding transcriptional regulator, XRE-family HTH domain [Sphingopyxis indica]